MNTITGIKLLGLVNRIEEASQLKGKYIERIRQLDVDDDRYGYEDAQFGLLEWATKLAEAKTELQKMVLPNDSKEIL